MCGRWCGCRRSARSNARRLAALSAPPQPIVRVT
jgi:hypothetical protein